MDLESSILHMQQPRTLVFGTGCIRQLVDDLSSRGFGHVYLVCSEPVRGLVDPVFHALCKRGLAVTIDDSVNREPDMAMFESVLERARSHNIDAVVGIGGGSVLDMAKLVGALLHGEQGIREVFGIGRLLCRKTWLACVPTTAGTGSEVSPNAILLDETENLKKGVVSPFLVPDAAYVDPELTWSVPPEITAATGLDALTHCIEAYANRFAHPMIDLYALKGIELINAHLETAYTHGRDPAARSAMALGSLYGGLCLGPVNTGAVHALAYPLGGQFHIPHGVSNAMLLPLVMAFNVNAAAPRYAAMARAMGYPGKANDLETAQQAIARIRTLSNRCHIPASLTHFGVPEQAVEQMAASAMTVTRLLQNNPARMTLEDAEKIYRALF